jgi:hypothetical protein
MPSRTSGRRFRWRLAGDEHASGELAGNNLARDAGAATPEYAGVLFVIVSLVGSVVFNATPVGGAIKARICAALSAPCGNPTEERARSLNIPCIVGRQDRTLGFNVQVLRIAGERKDSDRLTLNADGSASVVLSQSAGLGLALKPPKRPFGGKPGQDPLGNVSADAKATIVGDVGYLYNFPDAWGGQEAAQQFLEDNAGTLDRYTNLVVGPYATTIQEGAGWLGDRLGDLGRGVAGVFGVHESDADRAARERAEAMARADAIVATVSLQAGASVSIDAGLAKAKGGADLAVRGALTVATNTGGPDRGRSNFTGTFDLKTLAELTVGVPADPGRPGQPGTGSLPPIFTAGMGFNKSWAYRVLYDDTGQPTQLVISVETTKQGQGGLKPSVSIAGVKVAPKSGMAQVGTVELEERVLDLTDPANRAAFDGLFLTMGIGIGDHQARASIPQAYLPPDEMVARMAALQARFDADAFVAKYTYDLWGRNYGLDGERRREGDIFVAGAGAEDTAAYRELVDARAYDNRHGGAEQPLVTCQR